MIAHGEHPTVTFTVFQPDRYKHGGSYVTITDRVKKIDTVKKIVILMSTEGYGRVNRTISIYRAVRDYSISTIGQWQC